MLLNNPVKPSPYLKEAIVLYVDLKRSACKCRGLRGENFSSVSWMQASGSYGRSGSVLTPRIGDRVYISTELGMPIIVGFKPLLFDKSIEFPNRLIDSVESFASGDSVDITNVSNAAVRTGISTPPEAIPGDQILSSDGGAIVGALKGGSVLLKASGLAQVFLSRVDDLYRVVGRNQEVFSDVHVDIATNLEGRQYRFTGYSDTVANVRLDRYKYFELFGDTVAGEFLKGNYDNKDIGSTPAASDIIKRYIVADYQNNLNDGYREDYVPLYDHTLSSTGRNASIVRTADETQHAVLTHDFDRFEHVVVGEAENSYLVHRPGSFNQHVNGESGYNNWVQNGDQTLLDWNGLAVIKKDSAGITVDWKGKGKITITDSGITCDWNGTSKTVLTDSSATVESSGHKMIVSSSGIAMS